MVSWVILHLNVTRTHLEMRLDARWQGEDRFGAITFIFPGIAVNDPVCPVVDDLVKPGVELRFGLQIGRHRRN